MEMLKNAVNWVEIPVQDFTRAKKFYSAIYDFEMPEMDMGSVKMGILLSERDGVGAAIISGNDYSPSQNGTLVYLNGGKDLNTVLNRVESAGGKVMLPKTQITPEMGYYAYFSDPEGNKIGLHSLE